MIKKKLIKMGNEVDESYYLELFSERFKIFSTEDRHGENNTIMMYRSEVDDSKIDDTVPDFVITFRDKSSIKRVKESLIFLEENFRSKKRESLLVVINKDYGFIKVISTYDSALEFKRLQYGSYSELEILFNIPQKGHLAEKFYKKFLNHSAGDRWYKYEDKFMKKFFTSLIT